MIRLVTSGRRLLRKRSYNSPHKRHRNSTYYRENRNLVKSHQEKFRNMNGPQIQRKKRPKREVIKGFKMSYRYKYYNKDIVEEETEESE